MVDISTAINAMKEAINEGYEGVKEGLNPSNYKDYYEVLNNKTVEFNKVNIENLTKLSNEIYTKLSNQYNNELKKYSEIPESINTEINIKQWEKIGIEETAMKRLEFNKIKNDLIKEWEIVNKKEWLRYKEDIFSENGILIRKAGGNYDAHHIQPLEFGGKNVADNITPLSAEVHYDRQGIHASDGIYQDISDLKSSSDKDAFLNQLKILSSKYSN